MQIAPTSIKFGAWQVFRVTDNNIRENPSAGHLLNALEAITKKHDKDARLELIGKGLHPDIFVTSTPGSQAELALAEIAEYGVVAPESKTPFIPVNVHTLSNPEQQEALESLDKNGPSDVKERFVAAISKLFAGDYDGIGDLKDLLRLAGGSDQ